MLQEGLKGEAKKIIEKSLEKGGDLIGKALSPEKSAENDVFAPSDTDPMEYAFGLEEGISTTNLLLRRILYDAKWNPSNKGSVEFDYLEVRRPTDLR